VPDTPAVAADVRDPGTNLTGAGFELCGQPRLHTARRLKVMGLSDMYREREGLYAANVELRDERQNLRRDDRERRNEINETVEANIRRIAELKADIAEVKAENRQRLRDLYLEMDSLYEANRQIVEQIKGLHRDDREWRSSLNETRYRNLDRIAEIKAEIAEIRSS
jgi:hypothetical protein